MRTVAEEESEANYFAICLLMPEMFVHAEADRLLALGHQDEELVWHMATKFQVGVVAMTMRLVELGRMRTP